MNRHRMNYYPAEIDYAVTILKSAKSLLTTHGWTRRKFGDTSVGYCLMGAVSTAHTQAKQEGIRKGKSEIEEVRLSYDLMRAQALAVRTLAGMTEAAGEGCSVTAWNDKRDSVEPVFGLIDQAINTLEERA